MSDCRRIVLLSCLFLASVALTARSEESWGERFPEARERLVKLFADHPHFRDKLAAIHEEHPELTLDLVQFLSREGEHTVPEYIERNGKDGRVFKKIHEEYSDQMKEFRLWVHDHARAAISLFGDRDAFRRLDKTAERRERR